MLNSVFLLYVCDLSKRTAIHERSERLCRRWGENASKWRQESPISDDIYLCKCQILAVYEGLCWQQQRRCAWCSTRSTNEQKMFAPIIRQTLWLLGKSTVNSRLTAKTIETHHPVYKMPLVAPCRCCGEYAQHRFNAIDIRDKWTVMRANTCALAIVRGKSQVPFSLGPFVRLWRQWHSKD